VKRYVRFGSVAAAVAGGIVALLWMIKDRFTGPAPQPVTAEEAPKFRVPPPARPTATTGEADDLSEVKGIGPVYQARLEGAGIRSFAALGAADAVDLAERVEVPVSRVQDWIDKARRLEKR
jgi:predicted flap endonuclease-1-like 5' DNA nuclease